MYTIEQIRRMIAWHIELARGFAAKRNSFSNDTDTAEEFEVLCRSAVIQARLWHRRLLAEYGIAPRSVWLDEVQ